MDPDTQKLARHNLSISMSYKRHPRLVRVEDYVVFGMWLAVVLVVVYGLAT